jgi:hypothetical protein
MARFMPLPPHARFAELPAAAVRRRAKGAAHAVAIGETRLPRDDVDRMAALLHHQPGGLDP